MSQKLQISKGYIESLELDLSLLSLFINSGLQTKNMYILYIWIPSRSHYLAGVTSRVKNEFSF